MDKRSTDFDIVLVGGGLQSALLVMAIREFCPGLRVCLVESSSRLAGNHTWCFHGDDVPEDAKTLVAPLTEITWPGYSVRFPRHERDLASTYSMVSSERVHSVVSAAFVDWPGSKLLTDTRALEITDRTVTLEGGGHLSANLVVDSRGPNRADIDGTKTGYQKFVGLEVRTQRDHGLEHPIIMDARIEQLDGFRFLYVLPLSSDRLLLEDTRFSDTPTMDVEDLTSQVHAYASEQGYDIAEVIRSEQGVLPLPWVGTVKTPGDKEPIYGGFQGGWFHPVTGYSFPIALRLALYIAKTPLEDVRGPGLAQLIAKQQRQLDFGFRLNGMLFKWFAPEARYNVLERFYKLPEPLIRRFYAMQTTSIDRARIFIGRPPRGMSYKAAMLGRSIS